MRKEGDGVTPVLVLKFVDDEPCIYFDDKSWRDEDRREVRRCQGGLWQRGGYDSYMADDEWESLEGNESQRLEAEYQRLVKAGDFEDIDAILDRPEWIPVEERLPEGDEPEAVLGWNGIRVREVVFCPRCKEGEQWSSFGGHEYVICWMPMPAPPPIAALDLTPDAVAALREEWENLHKGPRPETDVVITDDMRAWHEAARDMAKTKGPAQTVGDLLFSGKGDPTEVTDGNRSRGDA